MAKFSNHANTNFKLFYLFFLTIHVFLIQTVSSSKLDENLLVYADDTLQYLLDRYERSDSEDFWHPNSFKTGVQSREVVKITNISKRTLPGIYKQWKYSQVGFGTIIAGLSDHWIDFYNENLRLIASINATETFVALATFSVWNERISKSELVVIVATEKPSLNSYVLTNDSIVYPGSWPLHNRVKSLELCVVDMSRKIIVVPQDDKAPVDIYNFETRDDSSELWFFQRLNVGKRNCLTVHEILSSSCSIAVAEENKISVYQYESQLGLFYQQHQFSNTSSTCKQLISFSLAYSRYLSLVPSGNQTVQFMSETGRDFLHQNHALIQAEEIVPLPVGDYRDEDVLLVRTPFNRTKVYSYDGLGKLFRETYVCSEDICSTFENLSNGVGILVNGTTAYFAPTQYGQQVATVLIIENKVENYLSPLYQRSRQLYDEFRSLSDLYKRFKRTVLSVTAALEDSLTDSGPNVITGNWDVKDLSSFNVVVRDSLDSNKTEPPFGQHFRSIEFIDSPLKMEDFAINDGVTENKLNSLQGFVENAKLRSARTVPRNSQDVIQITAPQNITANVISTQIESSHLGAHAINDVDRIEEFFDGFAEHEHASGKLKIHGPVKFNGAMLVNNLKASKVNNIPTSHFAHSSSKNVFNSTIIFKNSLNIEGDVSSPQVSGLRVPEDIILATNIEGVIFRNDLVALKTAEINEGTSPIRINKEFENSIFRKDIDQVITSEVQFKELISRNNSHITLLNGQNFADVVNSIVLRNHSGQIKGVKTAVNVHSSAISLSINKYLNSIPFPEGYVLAHEDYATIHGHKTFTYVSANTVALNGTINNARTVDMVRLNATGQPYLHTNWTLHGPVTFYGNVNVRDTVGGANISDLYFTDTLDSKKNQYYPNHNIHFDFPIEANELQVGSKLNQKSFEESCGNVLICKDNDDLTVHGLTTFENDATFAQLNIKSNKINSVPLESILDRNTEQTIKKTFVFTHPVSFEKLMALSEVDDVNLQNVLTDAVLLNEDQVWPPGLEFDSVVSHAPVNVSGNINEFEDFGNDVAVKTGRPFQVFESSLEIKDLQVEDLWVTSNLAAFELINGFDLSRWMKERVTLSGDAKLYEPIEILGDTLIEKNVFTKVVNGEYLHFLNNKVLRKDKLEQTIRSPLVIYGSMAVQGNVNIHETLNGYNLINIIRDSIPINSEQVENITGQWSIEKPVFHKLIVDGTTCNVDVKILDQDAVKKDESSVIFQGDTTFDGSLDAIEEINTILLNWAQFFSKIFTIHTHQVIKSDIVWKGNVSVGNLLEVQGAVNGVSLHDLKRIYSSQNGTHIVRSDVKFESTFQANHFIVDGLIQNQNLAEFLASSVILHSNEVQNLHGNVKFTQAIVSNGNVNCQTINAVDVSKLSNDVVRKNSDFTFTNRVCFDRPVVVQSITIDSGDVLTTSSKVGDIDIRELQSNSIPLHSTNPISLNNLSLERILVEGNVDGVRMINEIPFGTFVTRNTHQNIKSLKTHNLNLLQNGVAIKGLFGHTNILEAFANTLMTSDQVGAITGIKTFPRTVIIEGNLTTAENHRLSELVYLNEHSSITSQNRFSDLIVVTGDVNLRGKWNGYSLEHIKENALSSYENDVISADWNFASGVVFRNVTTTTGSIDGFNITQLETESRQKVTAAEATMQKEENAFFKLCQTFQTLYTETTQSPLKLQSFDEQQVLILKSKVANMLTVNMGENVFLLAASDSCGAFVFHWSTNFETFYESGFILETESVIQWSQASQIDSAIVVFHSVPSNCDVASHGGLYYTQGNRAGNFSSKSLIKSGTVVDFKLVTINSKVAAPVTLLFAVFQEYPAAIHVSSWSRDNQSFEAETEINFSSVVLSLDIEELNNENAAVLVKTRSEISIHTYSSTQKTFKPVSSVEAYGTPRLLKLFQTGTSLFALILAQESDRTRIKPSSNLQLFEATPNELRLVQTLQAYDTVTVEVVTINNQVFVLVLTKPVGLYVYRFMGLSGLQTINDYPLTYHNGEYLQAFYVTPWRYNTTLPFVLISSRNVVKLLHSNVIGNAVINNSFQNEVDHICDLPSLDT